MKEGDPIHRARQKLSSIEKQDYIKTIEMTWRLCLLLSFMYNRTLINQNTEINDADFARAAQVEHDTGVSYYFRLISESSGHNINQPPLPHSPLYDSHGTSGDNPPDATMKDKDKPPRKRRKIISARTIFNPKKHKKK